MAERTHWDIPWRERPIEEVTNLNPAFCGELLFRAVAAYNKLRRGPLSFAIAFLVLPIVLHKPTRDELPGRASAAFLAWTSEHGPLLAQLPDRVIRLTPVTRESLLFTVQHHILRIEEGAIAPGSRPLRLSAAPSPSTDDSREARSAASLLGRWFANQALPASILQGLGVSP
jgi:ABC-three component (ABC-3C) system Middle Component 3